jgi:phosphoglycolate phosphatase-like HAD superfamily hydrolase
MIRTLIVDLDGPVLDGKHRHYFCYQKILVERGFIPLDLESYWGMKRERADRREQLKAVGAEGIYEDFLAAWLELIEQPEALSLDRLQPGALEKLQEWRDQGLSLILVTLRRYPDRLHEQLRRLKLEPVFDHLAVCEHRAGGLGKAEKVRTISRHISARHCLWIGDTEVDIEGARAFGCRVAAVTCGLRTEVYLASLSPDLLSHDLTGIDLECCDGH